MTQSLVAIVIRPIEEGVDLDAQGAALITDAESVLAELAPDATNVRLDAVSETATVNVSPRSESPNYITLWQNRLFAAAFRAEGNAVVPKVIRGDAESTGRCEIAGALPYRFGKKESVDDYPVARSMYELVKKEGWDEIIESSEPYKDPRDKLKEEISTHRWNDEFVASHPAYRDLKVHDPSECNAVRRLMLSIEKIRGRSVVTLGDIIEAETGRRPGG